MKNKFSRLMVIPTVLILAMFILTNIARAQTSASPKYGLIISPLIQEYKGKPGDTIKGSFRVTRDFQDTTRSVTIYPYAKDFTSDGTTGNPLWIEYSNPDEVKVDSSLESWITINDKEVSIQKEAESKDITFTINIPKNATGGTKQAGIIFTENKSADKLSDTTQVGISSDIAGLVFVDVEGQRSINLDISDVNLTDLEGNTQLFNIFEYLPVTVNTTVKNNGNSIVEPGGDIFISPSGKTEITPTLAFNQKAGRILPKSSRVISETWDNAFWVVSKNQLNSETSLVDSIFNKYNLGFNFGKNFKIGVFDVVVKVIYFNEKSEAALATKTVPLIIFPWKIALGILFVIILIVIKNIIVKKVKKNRETKKTIVKEKEVIKE
ncbi:MAG: hypothetical protein WCO33_02205 [bacterium]